MEKMNMAKIKLNREGKIEEKLEEGKIKLVVASNIKSAVRELQVSGDVPDALNKKVIEFLERASERAKANGRRTLYARDL
jgi:histone H3/H4